MAGDNLFLLSLAVLILLVLTVLGFLLHFAARAAASKSGVDPKVVKLRFDSLRTSFRQAVEIIESNIAARSERYGIPWVLVLNEGQHQRSLPIEQAGVASALSSEAATAAATAGISWHFFDKGIVVEMQGSYLGSPDDESHAEKPWDEFLGLCRNYRPQRPFDSVVITVPAQLLLDGSPDAQLELIKLARLSHRRLWLAQNRFAMRFAVYIAVCGCENIEGFSAFSRALPESMRAGILGWSSPYDLATAYQGSWVDEAMSDVVHTLADTSAELFANGQPGDDNSRAFLLASRVAALQGALQAYTDELMRPSAYHEPFFFRGLYFTGDSSLAAQGVAGSASFDAPALERERPGAASPVSDLMQEPAFLKDLFEKKIFLEYGLARPSRQQLTRPVLSRVARVTAILVLGGWAASMGVATVQLSHRYAEASSMLRQVEQDVRYRNQALERGEAIPSEWYKKRTLALLAAIERLGSQKAWTVVLPGSWPIWDNLEQRVVKRIEREFGDIAIGTLRRELYGKASEITGVPQDDSTSELIIGGECATPGAGVAASLRTPKPSLAIDEQPELLAVQQYLSAVDRLDAAIAAMQRLSKPSANESGDLRLLAKYALGADLPENISQSIPYFRGGERNAGLSLSPIQMAVRCSLTKGMAALDQRIFANNDLLVQERELADLRTRLLSADASVDNFTETVDGLKRMLAVIQQQEALLAGGRGAWMQHSTPDLGPAYQELMARIGQSGRLLGQDTADLVDRNSAAEFQKFATEFAARFSTEAGAGIVWVEQDKHYVLSPERLALRDAVTSLLSQPFMAAPRERELPEVAIQGMLSWDTVKLDQAVAYGDAYRHYMAEGLVKFPAPARPSVQAFVNAQFAHLVHDRIVDALALGGRGDAGNMTDAGAFDAARQRLVKLRAFLSELGADAAADNLQRLVSQDAQARLGQINQSLNQYELYAVRGRDFSNWNGERGPMLQAFGLADVQAMLQYLALQFSRIEALGRQADIYLPSLGKSASEGRVAQRWQGINRELERYRLKNPNSSLIAYELFLTGPGADMDRSNCTEKMAGKQPGSRPADYFAEHHVQAFAALQRRCTELHATEQQEQWTAFAASFNTLAAGRQPFAVGNGRDVPDADYEDVGQLFRLSEKLTRVLKDPPGSNRKDARAQLVRRFSDQWERIRSFMSPLYPAEDGAVAGYDVAVEFRVNQSNEQEGNKVIDWALDMGPQTLRLRDLPRALRWEPGMPITLTLRLAKDAPGVAMLDPQQPAMAVEGKSVSYRYTDAWSLLRLIQRQREADGNGRSDARSQLLRMEFPIGTELGANAPPDSRARVYLRLTLSPVGKRTPLAWPAAFPIRAPDFGNP